MRIKRLRLSGFKSFVEPAELRIEPGLTGVVGPNGCGKSNVLEAIRWVMGEASARSMRGAGMEDVIFAGTGTRPARDFAEVTLSAERDPDEAAGAEETSLPTGPFGSAQDRDIEVTRRIERGAGSAYRINGRDVRAKDVGLLFADAATGAHSPALVSQGRIGAIIAARPAERRMMLEEAAGISGLHVRRRDAEQRLRATEANLVRLDELLADMEARAGLLRRQARSAERYTRLSEAIRLAEARLVYARWKEAADAADFARAEAQAADAVARTAEEAQEGAAVAQRAAAEQAVTSRNAAGAAREAASEAAHRLTALRAQREASERRLREVRERCRTLRLDGEREAALGSDADGALARLEAEIAALDTRIEQAEPRREEIAARLAAAEAEARRADAALAEARSAQAREEAERRIARAQADAARQRLAAAEAESRRLTDALKALGDGAALVERRGTARTARAQAEATLAQAGAAIRAAEAERESAAAERDRAQADTASARAALAALQSEAAALRKAVSGASTDRAIDQIRAHRGAERALAAALGDDLEASLRPDAPRRWAGAAPVAGDPALLASCVSLASLVEAPPVLARRLAQIGVVDTDDGSIALAVGQRLVTRDGRLRRWDGFVATSGGAAAAERLIRLNRLEELEQALPSATAALAEAETRIQATAKSLQTAREAAEAARRSEAAATAAIRDATRAEDQAESEIERLEMRRSGLDERVGQAAGHLADTRTAVEAATATLAALPAPDAAQVHAADAARLAESKGRAVAELRAEAATHDRTLQADRQRRAAAAGEHDAWIARAARADARKAELAARIAEAEADLARVADTPARFAADVAAAEIATRTAADAATRAAAAEKASDSALAGAEARLAEARDILSGARENRAAATARAEAQDLRRVEMSRIAGEKFECPPPLLPQRIGFDGDSIRPYQTESGELERLTQDRDRIGPVNLIAERELAELEGSRATSAAEREELGTAIHRLRGSIGSLNREGRARLLEAFAKVDRHFRSLFTTLFEGGQAHLELIESDDPLEAGLEILAQPPGKRLQSLTLLSGGEQALTAIALIFALFLTNPAPICVLDEVDAPLDDANIERFCGLLDRMAADTDTRYLIVTHNAVTMSRMHRLFGVTMVEKGVSRLVSVDLGGAEQLLAAE